MRFPLPASLKDYTASYPVTTPKKDISLAGKTESKYPVIATVLAVALSFTPHTTDALASVVKPDLRKTTLSQEVLERYAIVRNSFVQKSVADPVNGPAVEIGDSKQDDFYPQVKLSKWGNEVNFSARLIDDDPAPATIEVTTNKIKWKKPGREAHFYDLGLDEEGAFEHEVILNTKPASNLIQWSINTKDFAFLHQGALTQAEIDAGAERPDKYVDCIIAYHATKSNYVVGQKNYKTGQAFIIERIKLTDANNATAWATQDIDYATGVWTATLPQAFLDSAVYPVTVDPTFGQTSVGSTAGAITGNSAIAMSGTTGSNAGRVLTIQAYIKTTASANAKPLLANGSDRTLVTNGVGTAKAVNVSPQWHELFMQDLPAVAGSTSYYAGIVVDNTTTYYYNSGSTGWIDTGNSYSSPANMGGSSTNKPSIYAIYVENASILTGDQTVTTAQYGIWQAGADGTIKAEAWGPGGLGASSSGNGGGGGGYARVNAHAVTNGDLVPFSLGASGVSSWIVSPTAVVGATGGSGPLSFGAAGLGSGTLADVTHNGAAGTTSYGGGGAGSGGNGSGQTGGTPDGGNGGSYASSGGINGSAIGGGGGPVYYGAAGNGARGQIKITFTSGGGGGGGTDVTIAEGAGGTDALTRTSSNTRTIAEGAGGTDALSVARIINVGMAEGLAANDEPTPAINLPVSTPEGAGGTEAESVTLATAISILEGAGSTDALTQTNLTTLTSAEGAGAIDAASQAASLANTISEGAGATDNVSHTASSTVTVPEGAGATDTVSGSIVSGVSITITESATGREISELAYSLWGPGLWGFGLWGPGLWGRAATGPVYARDVAEGADAADDKSVSGVFVHLIDEGAVVTDTNTRSAEFNISIDESASAAEAASAAAQLIASLAESAGATDVSHVSFSYSLTAAEGADTTDAESGLIALAHNVAEAATVQDAVSRFVDLGVHVLEGLHVRDTVSNFTLGINLNVDEGALGTDEQHLPPPITNRLTATVKISRKLTTTVAIAREITKTISL